MWYNFVIELLLRTSIFALFSVIVDPYHFLNLLFHFPPSVQSVMWWRAANSAGGVPASEWPEVERAQLWHARQTSRCGAVQHAAMPWQRFLAQATMEAGTIVFLFLLHSSVSLSRCHVLLFTVLSFCTMKSVIYFFWVRVSWVLKLKSPYIQLGFSHYWATIQYNCDLLLWLRCKGSLLLTFYYFFSWNAVKCFRKHDKMVNFFRLTFIPSMLHL